MRAILVAARPDLAAQIRAASSGDCPSAVRWTMTFSSASATIWTLLRCMQRHVSAGISGSPGAQSCPCRTRLAVRAAERAPFARALALAVARDIGSLMSDAGRLVRNSSQ